MFRIDSVQVWRLLVLLVTLLDITSTSLISSTFRNLKSDDVESYGNWLWGLIKNSCQL